MNNEDKTIQVMIHDDGCGEFLDKTGSCPVCQYHPDMQSTAFVDIKQDKLQKLIQKGQSFLGAHRTPMGGK